MGVVLGTAGHIDHGKSALVRALTGMEPDRLPQEKNRGMTIELGFYSCQLPSSPFKVSIIDVPGHENFVRTMAAGVHAIDLVLFTVAVNDGIKPQTREHLDILHLLAIQKGIVVLTKSDLLLEKDVDLPLQEDLDALFRGTFLEKAPRILVSSKTGEGIASLQKAILEMIRTIPISSDDRDIFRLWIDRSFVLPGIGNIVTGTSLAGELQVQDPICIYPQRHRGRVREIQSHGTSVDKASRGERTALHVVGLDSEQLARGSLVSVPERIHCGRQAFVLITFLTKPDLNKLAKKMLSPLFLLGTLSRIAKIQILEERSGYENQFFAKVYLEKEIPLARGDRFLLRDTTPKTLGGGMILDIQTPFPQREFYEHFVLDPLDPIEGEKQIQGFFEVRGHTGLKLDDLILWLLPSQQNKDKWVQALANPKYVCLDSHHGLYALRTHVEIGKQEILNTLREGIDGKPLLGGIPREEIISRLGTRKKSSFVTHAKIFFEKIIDLCALEGSLHISQNRLLLGQQSPALATDLEVKARKTLEFLKEAKLSPPAMSTLADSLPIQAKELESLLQYLCRNGSLTKVSHEFFYEKEILMSLKQTLLAFLEKNERIDVTSFKNLTGLTRKHAIPLLEYFDRERITLRVGEFRKLRRSF